MEILLVFMYIFSFKIYSIIDSTVLVGLLLCLFLIFNKNYQKNFFQLISNYKKYFKWMFVIGSFLFLWSFLVIFINGTHDLSYIKTLFHLYCVIFVGIELFAYLKYKNKVNNAINYVIIAFLIQSCLQMFFFVFPDISKLFNVFRSQSMIELGHKYHNIRGIAITSSGFFALSSSYGIVFLLYFTKYNTLFENKFLKIFMFLILLSGTFFAGRTGFVSLFLIPFLLFNKIVKYFQKRKWKVIIDFVIIITLISGFIYFTYKIPRVKTVYNYSFELFRNILTGSGFETTSTNKLLKMYDVDISTKTFFIGDGYYTICENDNCFYYQKTDVGYLRKILYFGIVGILLSLLFQISIFNKSLKKKDSIIIFIFLMILELKGESFGIAIMNNSIIILYSLFLLYKDEKKQQNNLKELKNEKSVKIEGVNDVSSEISLTSDENEIKVSVIIPIYNAEKYITRTIDSFLQQTYDNLEIILVDDGSTDKTREILKNKYSNFKNIKIIYQKNKGAPSARNKGFKISTGEYIIFFDSDDYIKKNYIETAMQNATEYDLIVSAFEKVYTDSQIVNQTWKFNLINNLSLLESLYLIPPFPCNKIFKRKIIEDNNIYFDDLKMAQDLNFYLKYLQHVKTVKILDEMFVCYVVHENSVSRTYNMNLLDIERSIELAIEKSKIKNLNLIKLVRLKHYTTQLLKLNNYSKNDAIEIKCFFKAKAYENHIFTLSKKYKKAVKKYYIYLKLIFLMPYTLSLKFNNYVKRSIIK